MLEEQCSLCPGTLYSLRPCHCGHSSFVFLFLGSSGQQLSSGDSLPRISFWTCGPAAALLSWTLLLTWEEAHCQTPWQATRNPVLCGKLPVCHSGATSGGCPGCLPLLTTGVRKGLSHCVSLCTRTVRTRFFNEEKAP